MNWSELKLSTNELAHNSHRLIPKDSHINNVIYCYFLFKVSECPVRHKANSLDLPIFKFVKLPNFVLEIVTVYIQPSLNRFRSNKDDFVF